MSEMSPCIKKLVMDNYNEIMKTFVETMSKAPKECQECTRRHFIGCSGCEYSKYWENRRNG